MHLKKIGVDNKMRRTILVIFILSYSILFFVNPALCGDRFWVFFTDKGHYERLKPARQQQVVENRLSPRALERRIKRGISSFDKENIPQDLPLEGAYLKQLRRHGFRIHARSRWLNAVSGSAPDSVLREIKQLNFVKEVRPVRSWTYHQEAYSVEPLSSLGKIPSWESLPFDYGESAFQAQFHNFDKLHRRGLTGKGIVVAMFDTGFRLTNDALQHIPNQLIAQYDFVQMDSVTSNQPGDHPSQDNHGTLTLSALGGFLEGRLIGPAFDASFLLAKTEQIDVEVHLEEDNWAMAAEWADSLGADIVSSSLGYSVFDPGEENYTYEDMNGDTTIITRAANELAERGVLVVSAAGNEGQSKWFYITAPADGFQVLAVGALTHQNQAASFSSHGPTFDGRLKPDVSGLGVNVVAGTPENSFVLASGTSMATPLVAGIAAQILQQKPHLTVEKLLNVLRYSGDNAADPDNTRGWGRVDARRAWFLVRPREAEPTVPVPNPYVWGNGLLFFPVDLEEPGEVHLEVFNILGQKVARFTQQADEGNNLITWDARNLQGHSLPAGLYIFRIRSRDFVRTGKFTILH